MAKRKTVAKKTAQPVFTNLYVEYSTNTWVSRPRNSDDQWDRDDTVSEHTMKYISIAGDNSYPTITYPGVVEPGDKVYLVYAVYSTGDSFGHDESRCLELVSVHKNLDIAEWNYKQIVGSENDNYNTQLTLSQDNGLSWSMSPPWCGYFERLTYAKVCGFTVKPENFSYNDDYFNNSGWYDDIN